MKICLMADLHLSYNKSTIQYEICDWAFDQIAKDAPGLLLVPGDITTDGNMDAMTYFFKKLRSCAIPYVTVMGNRDVGDPATAEEICKMASPIKNRICGLDIVAINAPYRKMDDEARAFLASGEDADIIVTHFPPQSSHHDDKPLFLEWLDNHPDTVVFSGHLHREEHNGNCHLIRALDPDKSVGASPCITYYDTDTKEFSHVSYDCPLPDDWFDYLGLSCYKIETDSAFAAKHNMPVMELRENVFKEDEATIVRCVEEWRKAGGKMLSMHVDDICWDNGTIVPDPLLAERIQLANKLKVDQITQHTPSDLLMGQYSPDKVDALAASLGEYYKELRKEAVIAIENKHADEGDPIGDERQYGIIPCEVIEFMHALQKHVDQRVGVRLDVGHAVNNPPHSHRYTQGVWYSEVGKYVVGYHIHQVTNDHGLENHYPIRNVYDEVMSYASFFRWWNEGKLNKAPLIMEMRPRNSYEISMETFLRQRDEQSE
ncbi:MAG: metallophosphoesterase [Clostridia bacterium]|nr:metallophosphoesterase [Clostridia bacterium]